MKLMLALFLVSSSSFAIDTGDGRDGVCNISGGADTTITAARKSYQCKELHIDANLDAFSGSQAGAGGSAVVIKVQNNVTLSAGVTLDLSGADGLDGDAGGGKTGGAAGAGGSAGGGSAALAVDGSNGSGAGAGTGGKYISPFTTSSYGGGGGGGSYKTQSATAALDGDDVGGSGPYNAAGSNGSPYGNEAAFDSSFTGGSGGGAGGGGMNASSPNSGSSGGGGGGAIRIIAGGNISIDGTIISAGGKGGGTQASTDFTGAGGGGSGGAIWLQAGGTLTVNGSITAPGGAIGETDLGIGNGGEGGEGRIRLDDADGVITNTGTISPTPYSTSFTPTAAPTPITNTMSRAYTSGVSCARVSEENNPVMNLVNVILGMMIAGSVHYFLSRKSKV